MFTFQFPTNPDTERLKDALSVDFTPPRFAKNAIVLRPDVKRACSSKTHDYTLKTLINDAKGNALPQSHALTIGDPAKLFLEDDTAWRQPAVNVATNDRSLPQSLGDVNLVALQVCRASLLVAAAVTFVASLGATVPNNLRLACAASGGACILSMRFYTRLITLRRLPDCLGYRLESNAVAEAMRVANWTVVVAMLTWSALLLRGPYESPSTTSSGLLLHLTHAQWRTVGPVLMGFSSLLVIPVWHLFGLVQLSPGTSCQRIMWVLLGLTCIVVIGLLSTDVYLGIIEPSQACSPTCSTVQREELEFAVLSCSLWFGYSILAVLRGLVRVGNTFMPLLRDPQALQTLGLSEARAERTADRALIIYNGSLGNCMQRVAQMGRQIYLGFATLSIRTYDANSMQRLAAWAEFGGPLPHASHDSIDDDAPQFDATDDETRRLLITENDPRSSSKSFASTTPSSVMRPNERNERPNQAGRRERLQRLQTNEPELTQICTQIFDSLLAVLDVGTQALVAFGYATLTAPEQ